MITRKKIILDVTFNHKKHIDFSQCLDKYLVHLRKGLDVQDFILNVNNITLGERSVDILEVFNTIYEEFADELQQSNLSEECIQRLDLIYQRHKKVIEGIKNEL
jgi:hypothetical protein